MPFNLKFCIGAEAAVDSKAYTHRGPRFNRWYCLCPAVLWPLSFSPSPISFFQEINTPFKKVYGPATKLSWTVCLLCYAHNPGSRQPRSPVLKEALVLWYLFLHLHLGAREVRGRWYKGGASLEWSPSDNWKIIIYKVSVTLHLAKKQNRKVQGKYVDFLVNYLLFSVNWQTLQPSEK